MLLLGDLAQRHGVDFHLYADDSLLYIAFREDNCLITVSKMELLINDIRSWMTHNKLKFNDDKSKIIVLNGARSLILTFHRYKSDTNQSLRQILLHPWEWNLAATRVLRITFAMLLRAVFTSYRICSKSGGALQKILPRPRYTP